MKKSYIIIGVICLIALPLIGFVCNWFGRAATVAAEELDPRTLLTRYEWFKDASAQLDRKRADIAVYEQRIAALEIEYGDEPRSKWAREDREQFNVWHGELAGVTASYNGLAAEYNANMAKENYRFTNKGNLPQGATEVLPREARPYNYGESN